MSRNIGISKSFVSFVRNWYNSDGFIPLHAPVFEGNEKKYLEACIDSTFVSSVGNFVNEAEQRMTEIAGTRFAVATVNGTAALHLALRVAGVSAGHEVITQPLSFTATCNAISYLNAKPVFVDISRQSLGLSAEALESFLLDHTHQRDGFCFNSATGNRISACVPMHSFGNPVELYKIQNLCELHNISLIEDSAEAMGSLYRGKHVGSFGKLGVFSFNGNKIITCGGGGMIVTDDEDMAKYAKHLSTVAKTPHPWDFYHDEVGYNYRMPNLNAALLMAQMEHLEEYLKDKLATADAYRDLFEEFNNVEFFSSSPQNSPNHWLNVTLFSDLKARNTFLKETNEAGVMTRPAWILMPDLPAFYDCQVHSIENSRYVAERLVNIPSSVRVNYG